MTFQCEEYEVRCLSCVHVNLLTQTYSHIHRLRDFTAWKLITTIAFLSLNQLINVQVKRLTDRPTDRPPRVTTGDRLHIVTLGVRAVVFLLCFLTSGQQSMVSLAISSFSDSLGFFKRCIFLSTSRQATQLHNLVCLLACFPACLLACVYACMHFLRQKRFEINQSRLARCQPIGGLLSPSNHACTGSRPAAD